MNEEELVRRIFNAYNPCLASGLKGIMTTVDQLIKTGSIIEHDWASSKDYWSKIQSANHSEHYNKKKTKTVSEKSGELATMQGMPSLMVIPVQIGLVVMQC